MAVEREINIGREKKRPDVLIFNSAEACASNDQGNIFIIAEIKAPTVIESDGQLAKGRLE